MIRAYNEIYLSDSRRSLSGVFDIAINALGKDADEIALLFSRSKIASAMENGDPKYISGKSSTDILCELLQRNIPYTRIPTDRSPEYWAGWILAYSQWYLNKPFQSILNVIPFSKLISFYSPYHEAPEIKTIERIKTLFPSDTSLK